MPVPPHTPLTTNHLLLVIHVPLPKADPQHLVQPPLETCPTFQNEIARIAKPRTWSFCLRRLLPSRRPHQRCLRYRPRVTASASRLRLPHEPTSSPLVPTCRTSHHFRLTKSQHRHPYDHLHSAAKSKHEDLFFHGSNLRARLRGRWERTRSRLCSRISLHRFVLVTCRQLRAMVSSTCQKALASVP